MIDLIDEEIEIRQMFLEEAQEYVDTMDDGLVGIDPQSSTFKQQMDTILRAAHSLKGAAGIMQFHELSATTHRLEDSLKIIKLQQPDIDISSERLLLNAVGLLREIIVINRQGKDIDQTWLESYDLSVFVPLETYLNNAESHTTEDIPEPDIDIAALMFEQEIDEMLGNLEAKLIIPLDISILKAELQILASELSDLGEMLELPNFVELNQAIAQQVELVNPDQVTELAVAALAMWRRSQALVITGCKSDIPSEFNLNQQDMDELTIIEENYEESAQLFTADEIRSLNLESLDNITEFTSDNQDFDQSLYIDDELGTDLEGRFFKNGGSGVSPLHGGAAPKPQNYDPAFFNTTDELELNDLLLLNLNQKEDYAEIYEEAIENPKQSFSVSTELELDDLLSLNIESLDVENSNIDEGSEAQFLALDQDSELDNLFSIDNFIEDKSLEHEQNYEQIASLDRELKLDDLFGDRELTSQLTTELSFVDQVIIDSLGDSSVDFTADFTADNPFSEITEIDDILDFNPFTDILDDFEEDQDIFRIDSNAELLFEPSLIDQFEINEIEELVPLVPQKVSDVFLDFNDEIEDLFDSDSTELELPLINQLIDDSLEAIAPITSRQLSEQTLAGLKINLEPVFNDFGQSAPDDTDTDQSLQSSNQDTISDLFETFFNSTSSIPQVTEKIAAKASDKDIVDDLFDSFLEDSDLAQDLGHELSEWQQIDNLASTAITPSKISNKTSEIIVNDLFDGFLDSDLVSEPTQWHQMDNQIPSQAIIEELSIKTDSLEVIANDLFDGLWQNPDLEKTQYPEIDTLNHGSEIVEDKVFNSDIEAIGLRQNLSRYVKQSTQAIAQILIPDTLEELQEDLEISGDLPESIPSRVSDLVTSYVKDTSIRLPISRLQQLHDLSGEMIFGHNSLDGQVKQLRQLLNTLNTRIRVLEDANSQISTVYDRMTIEATAKFGATVDLNFNQIGGFDGLELDSYSELHSLSQSVSEAIVQLQEVVEDVDLSLHETEQNTNSLNSNFRQLQTAIKETKMRPLKDIVGRFPRVIRSLGLQHDKQVEVILNGADLLVEQTIIDIINDPLNHLLRNAFDHGIEDKQTRIKQGKNPKGKIELTATQKDRKILITLTDDGGGIDLQKIKAKIERSPSDSGLTSAQVASMDNNQLIQLIFEPGFTTTDQVTSLSGRGVGMDVVRTNLKQIGAEIYTETQLGVGTTFTIAIPFTLTVQRIALIEINQMILGIPSDSIQAVIPDLDFSSDLAYQDAPVIYQDSLIPIFPLGKHLQLNCSSGDRHLEDKPLAATKSILIINHEQVLWAIYVNGCWGEQEITLRQPMGKIPLPKIFAGCAIAANGQSVPILDMQVLSQNSLKISSNVVTIASSDQKPNQIISQKINQNTILVVDDSIAVRRYLALLLKKAGFKVEQAKDGEEAIAKLSAGLSVDIVLSDIEMPRLDGYGLLTLIKSDRHLQHLPVVMLTSRSGDKHRELAVSLGAAQYYTKPFAEEELIQCLKELALITIEN